MIRISKNVLANIKHIKYISIEEKQMKIVFSHTDTCDYLINNYECDKQALLDLDRITKIIDNVGKSTVDS
jgi:hypothetical protein